MKRTLSLLLSLLMVIGLFTALSVGAAGPNLTVSADSNYCVCPDSTIYDLDETVMIEFNAPEDFDLISLYCRMTCDSEKLELTGISTLAPDDIDIDVDWANHTVECRLDLSSPYIVKTGDNIATFVFTAKATGKTNVALNVVDMKVRENGSEKVLFKDGVSQQGLEYDLWVGSTQVTQLNMNDILNDGGKAKYNPATNTLILDNPKVNDSYNSAAVFSFNDLNVSGNWNMTSAPDAIAIWSYGNLTLSGDFTLRGTRNAVNATKNLTIASGTLKAISQTDDAVLSDFGEVIIENGITKVDAQGGTYAISGIDITIGSMLDISSPKGAVVGQDPKFTEYKTICTSDGTVVTHAIVAHYSSGFLRGDADGDGSVTVLDATRIQRYLAKLVGDDGIDLLAADADGDGSVTVLDATRIQRYLAKLCDMDGNPL